MSMRKIYRKIAKKHGVTAKEVRAEIQAAITSAYTDPINSNDITRAYQKKVPRRGDIPTPEELIRYASGQAVLLQRQNKQDKKDEGTA